MDSKIDAVREALIKLRSYAKSFGCDYQEECTLVEDDMCQSCEHVYIAELALAALSAIDPEAIRRECAEKAIAYMRDLWDGWTIDELRSAILSAEPAQDDGKPEWFSLSESCDAFESGYMQGHNDTVESCVRDSKEAAMDYFAELKRRIEAVR